MRGLAEPFHHGAHREHGENLLKISVNSVFSVVSSDVAHSFSHSEKPMDGRYENMTFLMVF